MVHRHVGHVLKGIIKMKQDRQHALPVLLDPRNRKRTALRVSCVRLVRMHMHQETETSVARHAIKASLQPLEATPFAQLALWGHIKIKLASLSVLPASPGAMQTHRARLQSVSCVGQGPTRQPMVPQLGAHNAVPGDTKTSLGRPGAMTAIVENTA